MSAHQTRRTVSVSAELYSALQLHCKGRSIPVSGLVEHVMNKVLGTKEGRALGADYETISLAQTENVRRLARSNHDAVFSPPPAISAATSAAPRIVRALPVRAPAKFVSVKEARAERRAGILPGSDVGGSGTRKPQPAAIPARNPGSRPFE